MSKPNRNDYQDTDKKKAEVSYRADLENWNWRREQIAREIFANVAGNVVSIAFLGGSESEEETQSRRTGMAAEATALAESLMEELDKP